MQGWLEKGTENRNVLCSSITSEISPSRGVAMMSKTKKRAKLLFCFLLLFFFTYSFSLPSPSPTDRFKGPHLSHRLYYLWRYIKIVRTVVPELRENYGKHSGAILRVVSLWFSILYFILYKGQKQQERKRKEKKKSGKVRKYTIVSGKRYVWNSIPL